ncbi:MAG: MarR family transcriptional regulator [Pseudomonadota bacterium]
MAETEIALLMDRFMRRTHSGIHEKATAFDKDRIGPGGGIILLTIADMAPVPIHDLVVVLARDKSQVTRAVQFLEKKDLVERETSTTDARVKIVSLTPKGERVVNGLRTILAETIGSLLSGCTRKEQEALRDLLSKALGTETASQKLR